ncbi:hypothetical protein L7F22_000826 [Adiantum nelumboides]|nr:hypothetical protein [Adiantum nelumboides]
MAASVDGVDAIFHQSSILPSGLPPAADELLQRMLLMMMDLVGSLAWNGTGLHIHQHRNQGSGTALRTPKLSVLGFASLLFGISSTLMLLGSFAFMLGFMLIPLILPASIVVCVTAMLPTFKESLYPSSPSQWSMWGSEILQKEASL